VREEVLERLVRLGPRARLGEVHGAAERVQHAGRSVTEAGAPFPLAHAGGPPILVYLLPQQLEKRLFVGTLVVFFMIVNALKLVPYGQLGQFHVGNLLTSAVLLPLAPLGIWLWLWMQKRIPDRAFYGVCYVLLFSTGVKLCWDGVSGL